MNSEMDVLREHLDRYRAVTLQFLDVVPPERLTWRPDDGSFTVGQHLQHIAQTEDYYRRGLFSGEWDASHLRLTEAAHDSKSVRAHFAFARDAMNVEVEQLADADLSVEVDVPQAPGSYPLRWWLWFLLEHEIHHKAQLSVYLKLMGLVAPFYAMSLPVGARPDIAARAELQGGEIR